LRTVRRSIIFMSVSRFTAGHHAKSRFAVLRRAI
jgi:hypothetical protein